MDFRCLPENIEQLAIGYVYSKGLIRDLKQINEILINKELTQISLKISEQATYNDNKSIIRTKGKEDEEVFYTASEVYNLLESFEKHCDLFRMTGAVHSCALADRKEVLIFKNDVARHNSLDKVIGQMLMDGIDFTEKAFVFSGRLALDMIEKAVRTGVKILIAPGAPTMAAVELAEESGLTLLGFVRKDNINIYSNEYRILPR